MSAYPDLNPTYATEVNPNWAPTPVKEVGPEPEPCELYFHKQQKEEPQGMDDTIKKEPFQQPRLPKRNHLLRWGEELYPTLPPHFQSQSTAKLTNMFVEDLPVTKNHP